MIVTVTLNPLIDRTLHIHSLKINSIHRTRQTSEIAGGKGINVARLIKKMGEDVHAFTFAGGGYGIRFQELLDSDGINYTLIPTISPTRFQVSLLDTKTNRHTDIIDNIFKVRDSEIETMKYEIENYFKMNKDILWLVLSGSAPQGKFNDFYYNFIKLANKYNINTILDSYGTIFKKGISAIPYSIKPNQKEAEDLLQKNLNSKVNKLDFIKRMWDKGITLPILSLGEEGIIAGYQERIWEIKPPKVKSVNATGSGDAFVGAFIVAKVKGFPIMESLRWGVAAGTANVMTWFPCNFKEKDIRKILPKVMIRSLA